MFGPYFWIVIMAIWAVTAILNIKASRITKIEYYLMWSCLMMSYLHIFLDSLN